MSKRQPKIDNHFTPPSQDQGSLCTLIFGAALIGLVLAAWVLGRVIGSL